MIRDFAQNLYAGAKVAVFAPVKARDFRAGWAQWWLCVLLTALITAWVDFAWAEPPRELALLYGLRGTVADVALALLAASLAAAWLGRPHRVLPLAIAFSVSMLLPWLLYIGMYVVLSTEQLRQHETDLETIRFCWYYLIAFRLGILLFGDARSFLAAAVLVGGVWVNTHYFGGQYWHHDYNADEPEQQAAAISVEDTLQNQHTLLQAALGKLKPPVAGKREIYGIAFAGASYQDVFMKEVRFAAETFGREMGMADRQLLLINNKATIKDMPLATSVNLREGLQALGKMLQPEDMLLLYLTSHGGKTSGVEADMGYRFDLRSIKPDLLAEMLAASGIKQRIIIVSACYSGTMIEPLQNPDTLIITASAKDRTSFGCSDTADLTYFADAYLKQALPKTKNFITAFDEAKQLVAARETAEKVGQLSDPQIFIGANIGKILQ